MNKIFSTSLFVFFCFIILFHSNKCTAQCPQPSYGSTQLCPGDSVFEAGAYIKTAGRYVYHYTLPGGCDSEVIFTVTFNVIPAPFLDTAVCLGNPVTLNALNPGASYLWNVGDSTTQTITVSTPGLYKVTVSFHSCDVTDSMRITSLPVIHLTSDTIICNGRSTALNPSGSSVDAYSWAPISGLSCSNCTNPTASPTITTTYFVYVNNGNCFNNSQITIHVVPVNFSPGVMEAANDSLCEGQTGNLTLTGDSGTIHWQFSTSGVNFADVNGQPGNNYLPTISQTTWFRVYSGNAYCSDTSNVVKLNVVPSPSDTFVTSTIDTTGLKVAFTPTITNGAIRYHWSFGDSTTSEEINPIHTYKEFKNYTVCLSAYNSLGCSDSACRTIDILNLGIDLITANDGITIYPNPASDKVILNTKGDISANPKVEIKNLLGHSVYNTTLNNKTIEISLDGLASGIYFISLYTDGKTVVKKLVKE